MTSHVQQAYIHHIIITIQPLPYTSLHSWAGRLAPTTHVGNKTEAMKRLTPPKNDSMKR
jgi:hypothetical protein